MAKSRNVAKVQSSEKTRVTDEHLSETCRGSYGWSAVKNPQIPLSGSKIPEKVIVSAISHDQVGKLKIDLARHHVQGKAGRWGVKPEQVFQMFRSTKDGARSWELELVTNRQRQEGKSRNLEGGAARGRG